MYTRILKNKYKLNNNIIKYLVYQMRAHARTRIHVSESLNLPLGIIFKSVFFLSGKKT